jgi:hypothetical protein
MEATHERNVGKLPDRGMTIEIGIAAELRGNEPPFDAPAAVGGEQGVPAGKHCSISLLTMSPAARAATLAIGATSTNATLTKPIHNEAKVDFTTLDTPAG